MSQGKELTYKQKQAIVDVKKYMDQEKVYGKSASTRNPSFTYSAGPEFQSINSQNSSVGGQQK